jgi:hypothetical protein
MRPQGHRDRAVSRGLRARGGAISWPRPRPPRSFRLGDLLLVGEDEFGGKVTYDVALEVTNARAAGRGAHTRPEVDQRLGVAARPSAVLLENRQLALRTGCERLTGAQLITAQDERHSSGRPVGSLLLSTWLSGKGSGGRLPWQDPKRASWPTAPSVPARTELLGQAMLSRSRPSSSSRRQRCRRAGCDRLRQGSEEQHPRSKSR